MQLILGDCLEEMKKMPENSVDSIVTDPPYGLSFMGKKWDYDVPSEEIWRECLRVLKPGGHLLSFAGTRTQHRMAVRIEDAGFEIRDMIAWIYGSGFPKSLNIGKAVDKLQGNEREVEKHHIQSQTNPDIHAGGQVHITMPNNWKVTKGTSPHEGWGTALKPALEPITVARKPLGEKTVAENVLTYGTGGINIDGCRISGEYKWRASDSKVDGGIFKQGSFGDKPHEAGRFPANLIHDGSEEVVGLFPITSPSKAAARGALGKSPFSGIDGSGKDDTNEVRGHTDNGGSAARFFYCAKASKKDRDEGMTTAEQPKKSFNTREEVDGIKKGMGSDRDTAYKNTHPTVKPTDLMRYLCRLVTPKGGTVLDPFMGSGSTGKAAKLEGLKFIGIEREAEYVEIANARIEGA